MEKVKQNKLQNLFSNKLFFHLLIGVISFLIIFSRRPDALTNPQFWAEDGVIWYTQAYQVNFLSLFSPELSYYCTFQRLIACFSQILPLTAVPLFFNLCAIALKITIVQFFVSQRGERSFGSLPIRLLLVFLYLGLPNDWEIDAILTNTQWHLALLGFLLLMAEPSGKIFWKIFDGLFLILTVLTGPYCFFLFPLAVFRWWQKRHSWTLWLILIITLGCFAQSYSMLTHSRLPQSTLGANFNLFLQILSGQIFTSAIVGQNGYLWLLNHNIWKKVVMIIATAGTGTMIYGFLKGTWELRFFIVYAGLIFAGALFSPAASATDPQWEIMRLPGVCMRYWFMPILSFLSVLIYFAAQSKKRSFKIVAICVLTLSVVGIIGDWKQPPFKNFEFQHYAEEFEAAPSGTQVVIPINPSHEMNLTKK